jgi:hypothetical protein
MKILLNKPTLGVVGVSPLPVDWNRSSFRNLVLCSF